MKVFIGLETDSDAIFKITHSYIGAEIQDLFFHLDVSGGNSFNTELKWRSGLGNDMKIFIKSSANYLESINPSEQTLSDTEAILHICEKSAIYVAEEIMLLSNLQFKSVLFPLAYFNTYVKDVTSKNSEILSRFVDYYIGGIDEAVLYRYVR